MTHWRRWMAGLMLGLGLLLGGPLAMLAGPQVELEGNWATSDRSSAGLAPDPAAMREAVVQVYAARAFGWRGAFGAHTWLAVKPPGAQRYRVLQVTGWRRPTVSVRAGVPDRAWYGSLPALIADYRGAQAAALIPAIEAAVERYPFRDRYRVWPGPNSNTFVAWVIRQVPGLEVALPATAIGKDYLVSGWLARTPSDSGYQFSFHGLLGATLAAVEGIEVNLLGLTLGVDVARPALKLPGIGRVGLARPIAGAGPAGEGG
ncbi:DUF3750 domain-containing protein [Halomonas sp. IOP_31]|uniref:DUF3750 domain-containing protein n=1 Tax=Halomonas sp. IOP_31 TaxID=2876584 RepID=UPI001E32559D|nr:DUF3750 domain-containing protein [Halomonas sp. IOP_31]MCD6007173.1 DUF3750 domain-containing protein [Halomonas sp. IOP_31]